MQKEANYSMNGLKKYSNIAASFPLRILLFGLAVLALLSASACTKSSDALTPSGGGLAGTKSGVLRENSPAAGTKDESGAKIIRETSALSKKGTNIKVLVNNSPITNYDIKRRAAFLKLRRVGGNRTQKATEELIEEKIKMQEASKRRSVAKDPVVNKAYASFAKRNRLSTKQMGQIMARSGVTSKHFKEFLRTQISWQRTVGTKFRTSTRKLSESDALFKLRNNGEAKPETREYKLQQIIFVVPKAKRKKILRTRVAEAKSFRQKFISCGDTLVQIKELRDVAIKDLGRVLEPELPPRWKDEVVSTELGKTTRVKETEKGAEFLAVCGLRNVSDDRTAQLVSQSKEFSSLNTQGSEVSKKYLAELRSKATIVYR